LTMVARGSDEFATLQAAVRRLYYAGRWSSPTVDATLATTLWEDVRDAAGFAPGGAPE
jgi:hypothetical protein